MTADREFVSTTGTRHRPWWPERFERSTGEPEWPTVCGVVIDLTHPVVQQPVKDCKRCYPKGRTE